MKKTTKILSLAAASLLAACSNQAAPAKETTTAAPGTTVQQTTQAPATTATNTTVTTNASEDAMGRQNEMQKEIVDAFKKEFPTGVLREWSVDKDNGEIIWEFDLFVNEQQVNVKISNATGKITEIDR